MKLYSGRFEADAHPALDAINKSIGFDIRLWPYDIAGSKVHASMLGAVGLLSQTELDAVLGALDTVHSEFEHQTFVIQPSDEDIHTAVERRVTELVGEAGKKLHTSRSRNDQVATDLRLFALDAIVDLRADLLLLVKALTSVAERNINVALPAYTHLQRGMPVLLAHHLLAYVEMFRRDDARLADTAKRTRVSPLGSGACTGTGLPNDREATARALGFERPSRNSLDAVSDRDFVLELLSNLSIMAVHISRLGEELVLWCSLEFGFCRPHDSVSTGSSMMPQKKNPDGAELMRGKAGRVFGSLITLLTTLKGLPLAYNKDMQEDKEPLFDAVDTLRLCLQMSVAMVGGLSIDADKMRNAITPEVFATDVAERLVAAGTPLRTAHEIVASLVRYGETIGKTIVDLDDNELSLALDGSGLAFDRALLKGMTIEASLTAKDLPGGTAPGRVRAALDEVREWTTLRTESPVT